MKITVIGKQFPDSLARNLSFTLKQMGAEVQELDEDRLLDWVPFRRRLRKFINLAVMHPRVLEWRDEFIHRRLADFRPQVVLNTYRDWGPRAVAKARGALGRSTRFLFLYPDAIANLGRHFPLGAEYDALFFKDAQAVDLFRSRLGINAIYLPEACNPSWHTPVPLSADDRARYGCELTTAGNVYYYRALILNDYVDYELKIWGPGFPSWLDSPLRAHFPGVYVAEVEKAKAFLAAKIVINTFHPTEVSVNVRMFETAGCGGFQIAEWRPAVEEFFRPDEEVVLFQSREELKEKVDFYLARPDLRDKIAEAGRRRAHEEHTYRHRLERVLQVAEAI